ncbi:MAG: hypothetical protein ACREDS_08920 [Limisphaerales bacterium]
MDSSLCELIGEAATEEKQLAAIQGQRADLELLREASTLAPGEEAASEKA